MSDIPDFVLPERGTSALRDYLWSSMCDARLFHFTVDTVLKADYSAYVIKRALEGSEDYKELTPSELARKEPGTRVTVLRQSRQELLEMFLGRAVDSFQTYLVDVIRLVLHTEPRILSERKQELTLGHILKFESIEALARDIVEGKVLGLSYEGFGEVEAWCASKAIPLVIPQGERERVVELVALRNIVVHSRGLVDERYKAAVPASTTPIGEKRVLDVDDLFGAQSVLNQIAQLTDAAIAGKFRLSQCELRKELSTRAAARWRRPEQEPKAVPSDPGTPSEMLPEAPEAS